MIILNKKIILTLMLAVVISSCASNNKVDLNRTSKQEGILDSNNAHIEHISQEDVAKIMEAMGGVDITKYDAKEIDDYGQKIDVNGKKMNIYITGSGEIPLVILPGQGEFSARYAYKNMIDILEKSYKLYIVEPFGYGLSDQTDTPRTIENITEEIHIALKKLNLDKYYLVAHSLGGIYALNYSKQYPNEVKVLV